MERIPHILEVFVLFSFMCCTATLFILAVVRRLRIGKPVKQFRTGWLLGLPLFQSLFLCFVTILYLQGASDGLTTSNMILLAYMVSGAWWVWSTVMSQSVYVTRSGIVTDLWSSSGFLPWWRVSDYFSVRRGHTATFAFFVEHHFGLLRRVEFEVPSSDAAEFTRAIDRMTAYRFSGEDFANLPVEWQSDSSYPKSASN